jgi:hypothetical protein
MSQTPDAGLRDDELDPDGDPAMMAPVEDTSGTEPVDGVAAATPVQDDPEDRDDPDADPEMLTSGQ